MKFFLKNTLNAEIIIFPENVEVLRKNLKFQDICFPSYLLDENSVSLKLLKNIFAISTNQF